MSTYFLLDPFEFPYYFYRIRGELIYVLSIVVCIPSTFCPTLGHHQGRIYYKSDVTFVLICLFTRSRLYSKVLLYLWAAGYSPDDGPKSGESTRDTYNYGQCINQFPTEYDKSNTGIRTDPEENM